MQYVQNSFYLDNLYELLVLYKWIRNTHMNVV